ncbi:phytanoyl-CoA dioxygenase family protein [Cladophialophora carrionii]|uniref:Phytanoyl-CoA dioxygenase family protein n=1 Tax=Cladophialophora carrionii TaxID=86049 RepID=A0A1C1CUS8_9EURO|nr:phytanoyl-CoA dioxygenase family protein [Cladophialophora carrionii]
MGSYTPVHDQTVHTVHIPEDVRISGKPTLDIITEGVSFLHKDGIIVLDNAIDVAHIDTLNDKLSPEALEIANDPDHHFNFGKHTRNMDQAPPPTRELMFKDVWCNPFAAAILSAVIGPKPVIHYANGNTALKADPKGRQPVHSDCEFAHPAYFPFAYVININLVDVTPRNGGTEVWVGSHHVSVHETHNRYSGHGDRDGQDVQGSDGDGDIGGEGGGEGLLTIKSRYLDDRRKHSPPIQISTKKGSLIIRDLRLWHAGMPNLTDEPRIMLAFVASPNWWQGRSKIALPADVKDMVEQWAREEHSLLYDAEWIEGEVNHKKLRSAGVDFDTKSAVLERYKPELSVWPEYRPRWY